MKTTGVALCFFLLLSTTVAAQLCDERPSDRLLLRQDLQQVVNDQVERNSAMLIAALSHDDAGIRARAAFALASVQDSSAISGLLLLLNDTSPQVRADAAFALGQNEGIVSPSKILAALAREEDTTVKSLLLDALGKKGDAASLVTLLSYTVPEKLLPNYALTIARYAVRGLHSSTATERLLPLLQHRDDVVRLYAAHYFNRNPDAEVWKAYAGEVRSALDRMERQDEAAMHLVMGLGRLKDPGDVERISDWLSTSGDLRIRVNAARALSNFSDQPSARTALLSALNDPSEHVAITAASALRDAPQWSNDEVSLITDWIDAHPEDWRISEYLLQVLARNGDEKHLLNVIDERLQQGDTLTSVHTLPALAFVSFEHAWKRLVYATEKPLVYQAKAYEVLAERWAEDRDHPNRVKLYYEIFERGLRTRDLAIVYTVAPILADSLFQGYGAVPLLMEVYRQLHSPDDIEAMTAILNALGTSGDVSVKSLLESATSHPHPVVARAASEALAKFTRETTLQKSTAPPPEKSVDWNFLKSMGSHPEIILETEKGTIDFTLYAEAAPLTVQTLIQFVQARKFDGVPFHRVVPNFVIQGGDFARADGFGGPGFTIRSEFTRISYRRGIVGMASAGKDTEGSQFFITHSMQPHLDGRYSAFGCVHQGMEVADRIYAGDRILRAYVRPDLTDNE